VNCSETETLVHAYVDGELDAGHVMEFEQHLHNCSACDQAYKSCKDLHNRLGSGRLSYFAPAGLRERIQAALPRNEAKPKLISVGRSRNWQAIAASLLLGVIAGGTAVEFFPSRNVQASLADQLIASHVRSQMLESHRVDVESSDQHTVKPWFKGKLDFSPSVHDLADKGYPLVGGRLDYLDQRPVAALVYQRRQHLINLFIWPVSVGREETSGYLARQGYHFIHWVQSDTNYWAVSDLNQEELNEFAALVKERSERAHATAQP
jgi:anti-sigma factor RsiW